MNREMSTPNQEATKQKELSPEQKEQLVNFKTKISTMSPDQVHDALLLIVKKGIYSVDETQEMEADNRLNMKRLEEDAEFSVFSALEDIEDEDPILE